MVVIRKRSNRHKGIKGVREYRRSGNPFYVAKLKDAIAW